MIQSVLYHYNFVLINCIYQSLFRHILTHQTIKVLVKAPLLTCKESAKVARAIERLVNLNMRSKFFTVFIIQCFHPFRKWLKHFNIGPADQVGSLVSHLDYDPEAALALDHRHNDPLMVRANDRVAFPMDHLLSGFDMRRPITQGAPMRDLDPPVPPSGIALSLLLLATKVLAQHAASSLVKVNILVKRLMAEWHLACNLLRAPIQFKQLAGLLSHSGRHCGCVPAFLRTLGRTCACLLRPVTFKAPIARKLSADVDLCQSSNLAI